MPHENVEASNRNVFLGVFLALVAHDVLSYVLHVLVMLHPKAAVLAIWRTEPSGLLYWREHIGVGDPWPDNAGRITKLRLVRRGSPVSNKFLGHPPGAEYTDRFKSRGLVHEDRDRILRSMRL